MSHSIDLLSDNWLGESGNCRILMSRTVFVERTCIISGVKERACCYFLLACMRLLGLKGYLMALAHRSRLAWLSVMYVL